LVFSAGADTVTWAAHGYINEDIVSARTDSTFPAGLTEGDWFVRNKTTNTFQLSATRTGAVVDITNGTFTGTVTLKRWNYADHQDGTLTLGHPPFGIVTCDVINRHHQRAGRGFFNGHKLYRQLHARSFHDRRPGCV